MLNANNERELAYVVQIDEIRGLPGYDRVESVRVNGWWCIVPKGQFQVGSLGVYFEIDSLVDATNPAFAFMEKRNYRVKTQKMCKSISQGLLMGLEDLNLDKEKYQTGDFLTKELNVKYYEAEDNVRKAPSDPNAKYKAMAGRHPKIFSNPLIRKIYKTDWGKKFLFVFFGRKAKKAGWPAWVTKTDEERVQNMPWILEDKSPWIATEKIDGTSTTFTMKRKAFGRHDFYICSRNVVFDKPNKACFYDTNVYVEMAEKYNVEEVLATFLKAHPDVEWITLQGETYGAGIQKRDYGMTDHQFAGFNLITSADGRWNSHDAAEYCKGAGIPWVPILTEHFILPATVDELLTLATGESEIDGGMREGIVFRSQDGVKSFKAVSNEFLLKYHG